ncbi:MAG TPA: histidinol-phosphate transaminase [Pyrinomonadaceae bacterium]|nr:histidinol-phosphate transaminase [Pyrinomonadaceae bacterium]
MSAKKQISVVIAVRDGEAHLAQCLTSLLARGNENFEVVVVDDCSSDQTATIASKLPCRLVTSKRRVGPGKARNLGVDQASGDFIFFTDADVVCAPDVVERAANFLTTNPDVAGVIGAYTKYTPPTNFVSRYKNLQHHFVHHQSAGTVAAFFTACGMIRREAFEAAGRFNEDFADCALEDLELGLRLDAKGYKVVLNPALQVTHLKHYTLRRLVWIEFVQRAIPYTLYLLNQRRLPNELSIQWHQRISCVLLYVCLAAFVCLLLFPSTFLVILIVTSLLIHGLLNRKLFDFLRQEGGTIFALGGLLLQTLSYVYSAPAAFIGAAIYFRKSLTLSSPYVRRLANSMVLDVVPFRPETHSPEVLRFGFNENPIGPSPLATEAVRSMLSRVSRYPADDACELKRVLANNLSLKQENFVIGNGASELLELIARCFVQSRDEIIHGWPTFPMYLTLGKLCGARNLPVPLRDSRYDLDAILERITKRTKLIFVTNPNNPTGTVVEQSEIERFMRKVPNRVIVVFDEAYIECLEPGRVDTLKLLAKNVIVVRTFSKVRGLAGLRIGYATAKPEIVRILEQIRRPFNTSAVAQAAAIAALNDDEHLAATLETYRKGREYFYKAFGQLNLSYIPSCTNFVLVDLRRDSLEIARELLRLGVLVKPVPPTQVRVSVGSEEHNTVFCQALTQVLRPAENEPQTWSAGLDGPLTQNDLSTGLISDRF